MTDAAAVEELLGRLAPAGAGVAACTADAALVDQLSVDESALVMSARPDRRTEFAAGRSCAHRALAAIGAETITIGRGPRRQPVWPSGVAGSISHAGGLAAAVALPTRSVRGLGMDVELANAMDEELWPYVLTTAEQSMCARSDDSFAAVAVFSAKEAAFKALYPIRGTEVDFLDARCVLDGGTGMVRIPCADVTAAVRLGRAGPFVVSVAILTIAA